MNEYRMPDPNIPPPHPYNDIPPEEILALRTEYLMPNHLLYYKKPIAIVEGKMQYLYDSDGKQYLDAIAGIVTERDVLAWASEETSSKTSTRVEEIMTREVITVEEDCPIEDAARLMRDNEIGGLPVMRGEELVGIITESDLFDVFLELLMAEEKGVRLTVLAPYVKGSLAQISAAITEAGGLILALNTFRGEDEKTWGCHLKVGDISSEELLKVVEPLVVKVLDVREI